MLLKNTVKKQLTMTKSYAIMIIHGKALTDKLSDVKQVELLCVMQVIDGKTKWFM